MRRVERPDLRIRGTYGAPSAVSGDARSLLKQFEIIGDLRTIRPRLEYDATTAWRFRDLDRNRRWRRRRLALVNHRAFAVENANMRLIHRDIEASEIVRVRSPLPMKGPIVAACEEELPPITRC